MNKRLAEIFNHLASSAGISMSMDDNGLTMLLGSREARRLHAHFEMEARRQLAEILAQEKLDNLWRCM